MPVLQKVKTAYALWNQFIPKVPKSLRYTLGQTVDKYFLQTIESILVASFLQKQEKLPFVKKAIISLDVLKFLLLMVWEMKAIDEKKYTAISLPLFEAGKQLGGWNGQLTKQFEKQNLAK